MNEIAARSIVKGSVRGMLEMERKYRADIDRRIEGSLENGPCRLRIGSTYVRARTTALRWLVNRGGLWIADGLNLTMCLALDRGDTFLDIGANVGWVTEKASWLVGRCGTVHSFEPSPSTLRYLRQRAVCLGLRNVVINGFALGREVGKATLYEFQENYGGASSLRPASWPGHSHAVETEVEVQTLDEYLHRRSIDTVRLVKIDVQGSEVDVLLGGTRLFASRERPVLFVEIEKDANRAFGRTAADLLGLISEFGFKMYSWRNHGLMQVCSEADIPSDGHDDVICFDPRGHANLEFHLRHLAERRNGIFARIVFGSPVTHTKID